MFKKNATAYDDMVAKSGIKPQIVEESKPTFSYTSDSDNSQMEAENKILRETVAQLQQEMVKYQQPALMLCEIVEAIDNNRHAIIKVPNGNQFFVNVAAGCEQLLAGDSVLCEQKNLMVLKKVQQ